MAARDTRMLLLGAVAMFEPVNGYQIRRELTSWGVDDWANLKPGSIYSGLTTLEKQDLVVRHDLDDDTRTVAVYEITASGREELTRLMGQALENVTMFSQLGFQAAFGMLPLMRRDVVLDHLRVRQKRLREVLSDAGLQEKSAYAPPHALRGLALWRDGLVAERDWLADVVDRLESGEFDLLGEEWRWVPPSDDAGRQMAVDRERYRSLLGR